MTTQEAKIILHWRCKHDYSFSSIGMTARAIWGDEWCDEFTCGREGHGRTGEVLLCCAEKMMGLETCDSDEMVWIEGMCNKCKYIGVYLTPKKDTAKECAGCGEMSVFIPVNSKLWHGVRNERNCPAAIGSTTET